MTRISPDVEILDSSVDTYLNYDTLSANVAISGSMADGSTRVFTAVIPYIYDQTRADIYARNLNTNIKRPVSGGPRQSPYQRIDFETATQSATYDGVEITYRLEIFNGTGGTINLIAQTFEVTAVLYRVPY